MQHYCKKHRSKINNARVDEAKNRSKCFSVTDIKVFVIFGTYKWQVPPNTLINHTHGVRFAAMLYYRIWTSYLLYQSALYPVLEFIKLVAQLLCQGLCLWCAALQVKNTVMNPSCKLLLLMSNINILIFNKQNPQLSITSLAQSKCFP